MADPTIQTAIWKALKTRVQGLSFTPAIPLVFPASKMTADAPRIEVKNIVVAPERVFISGQTHERRGTLQLTLKHLLPVVTYEVTQEQAGVIAEHFPMDLKMSFNGVCVQVLAAPEVHEGFEDEGYWVTPVRVRWRAFA